MFKRKSLKTDTEWESKATFLGGQVAVTTSRMVHCIQSPLTLPVSHKSTTLGVECQLVWKWEYVYPHNKQRNNAWVKASVFSPPQMLRKTWQNTIRAALQLKKGTFFFSFVGGMKEPVPTETCTSWPLRSTTSTLLFLTAGSCVTSARAGWARVLRKRGAFLQKCAKVTCHCMLTAPWVAPIFWGLCSPERQVGDTGIFNPGRACWHMFFERIWYEISKKIYIHIYI